MTTWAKFRKTLDTHIGINSQINNTNELDYEVDKLTHAITRAKQKHTHIRDLIKDKNKIRTQWQRNCNTQTRTQMTNV